MYEHEVKPRYVLWHRKSKNFAWREIVSAESESALTAVLVKQPTGECIVLPAGEHPRGRRAGHLGASRDHGPD
jgi:hypothetical protein